MQKISRMVIHIWKNFLRIDRNKCICTNFRSSTVEKNFPTPLQNGAFATHWVKAIQNMLHSPYCSQQQTNLTTQQFKPLPFCLSWYLNGTQLILSSRIKAKLKKRSLTKTLFIDIFDGNYISSDVLTVPHRVNQRSFFENGYDKACLL